VLAFLCAKKETGGGKGPLKLCDLKGGGGGEVVKSPDMRIYKRGAVEGRGEGYVVVKVFLGRSRGKRARGRELPQGKKSRT